MSKETLSGIIGQLNSSAMTEFKNFSSAKKVNTIFKNFQDYYTFQEKSAKAKTEQVRDRYNVEIDRHFALACKQLKNLNEQELAEFINRINKRLQKSIDDGNDTRLVQNTMLYRTILGQLPIDMSEHNSQLKESAELLLDELDAQLEK